MPNGPGAKTPAGATQVARGPGAGDTSAGDRGDASVRLSRRRFVQASALAAASSMATLVPLGGRAAAQDTPVPAHGLSSSAT